MLIAVDWGTTHLRAWLMTAQGHIVDSKAAPLGISQIQPSAPEGFAQAWAGFAGEWLAQHPHATTLMCGMVGARQGWLEAPYLPCPAGLTDLAAALIPRPFAGGRTWVVPGLKVRLEQHIPDVMRGEETLAMGCWTQAQSSAVLSDHNTSSDLTVVIPGTHSKWLTMEGGRITRFGTYMTGEAYGLLGSQSLLSRMLPATDNDALHGEAFDEAVFRVVDSGDSLLHCLFAVRTLALFDELPLDERRSYLSGLLIGEELRTRLPTLKPKHRDDVPAPITIAASAALTERYARALALFGVNSQAATADACAKGLLAIAQQADLI